MPAPPPLSDPATVRATAVELLRFTQPPFAILPRAAGNATRHETHSDNTVRLERSGSPGGSPSHCSESSESGEDAAVDFGDLVHAAEDFDKRERELHRGSGGLAGHDRAVDDNALF